MSSSDSPKWAALWAAVSSERQAKEISLDDQLRLGHEAAERHNLTIAAELIVPGQSRSIVLFEDACKRIGAYADLHKLIQNKSIDVFIFLNRSRLGRKASLSMTMIELCREAGILCYELENPPATLDQDDSHDQMLTGAIKSVGAQREIITLQHRHAMGMLGRIQKGKFPAGIPYGYLPTYTTDVNGKRILQSVDIDPVTGPLIRRIFLEFYLQNGWGLEAIANKLNEMGHRSPTGLTWDKVKLSSVLNRVNRYAGFSKINKRGNRQYTKAPGNWPAIISEAEAQAIEAERLYRRSARRSVSNPSLFSGVVFCQRCGCHMTMATNTRNRPSKRLQLSMRCPVAVSTGQHLDGHKKDSFISVTKILKAVKANFADLRNEKTRFDIVAQHSAMRDDNLTGQLAALDVRIKQLSSSQKTIDVDYYIGHKIDNERLITELERQLQNANATRHHLQTQLKKQQEQAQFAADLVDITVHGVAMLESPDVKAANAWLKQRLKIYVMNHEVVAVVYGSPTG